MKTKFEVKTTNNYSISIGDCSKERVQELVTGGENLKDIILSVDNKFINCNVTIEQDLYTTIKIWHNDRYLLMLSIFDNETNETLSNKLQGAVYAIIMLYDDKLNCIKGLK